MRPWIIAIILLAGCAAPEMTTELASDDHSVPGDTEATTDADDLAQGSPGPEILAIDFSGKKAAFVCPPTGSNGCMPVAAEEDVTWSAIITGNRTAHIDITVTWDDDSSRRVKVGASRSDGTTSYGAGGVAAEGSSPVHINDTLEIPADANRLEITLGEMVKVHEGPVYAKATPETPFHVAGTITLGAMQ